MAGAAAVGVGDDPAASNVDGRLGRIADRGHTGRRGQRAGLVDHHLHAAAGAARGNAARSSMRTSAMTSRASGASSAGAPVTTTTVTAVAGGAARTASSAALSRCRPRIASTRSPVSVAGSARNPSTADGGDHPSSHRAAGRDVGQVRRRPGVVEVAGRPGARRR